PRAPDLVRAAEGGAPAAEHILVHGRRDLAVVDDELEVLPDADDVLGHPHALPPGADLDVAVAVVDDRRRPVHQRPMSDAIEVEATAGRVQLETAVEGGHQARAGAGRDARRPGAAGR